MIGLGIPVPDEISEFAHDEKRPQASIEPDVLLAAFKIAGIEAGKVFRNVDNRGNVGASLDKASIGKIVHRLVKRAEYEDPENYAGRTPCAPGSPQRSRPEALLTARL